MKAPFQGESAAKLAEESCFDASSLVTCQQFSGHRSQFIVPVIQCNVKRKKV